MMTILQQQCYLTAVNCYKLTRKDGTPAIDGIYGTATRQAIYNFQLIYRRRPGDSVLKTDGYWGPATEQAIREVIGNNEQPQAADVPTTEPPKQESSNYKWVSINDFRCRCGGKFCNGWPAEPHTATLDLLEKFGEHFQGRIRPHSGLRCPRWNAHEHGAVTSKHQYGMAMDFHIDGVTPQELYDYGETLMPDWGGLGIYSWGIHVDDRPVKGRWRG